VTTASSSGFSKAERAQILTREGDRERAWSASGGIGSERFPQLLTNIKYPPDKRSRATGNEAGVSIQMKAAK